MFSQWIDFIMDHINQFIDWLWLAKQPKHSVESDDERFYSCSSSEEEAFYDAKSYTPLNQLKQRERPEVEMPMTEEEKKKKIIFDRVMANRAAYNRQFGF